MTTQNPKQGTLTPHQAQRLGWWSKKRSSAIKRAWQGLGSPRRAIGMMCLECCGEDMAAVRGCADNACPIHAFRPYKAE